MKTKDKLSNYWVSKINQLLKGLNLDTIKPENFSNLMVQNTEDILTITVICTDKMLVLHLDETNSKLTGGWKHF